MGWSPSPKERHFPFPISARYHSRRPQKNLADSLRPPRRVQFFLFLLRYEAQKITVHQTRGAAGHNFPVVTYNLPAPAQPPADGPGTFASNAFPWVM